MPTIDRDAKRELFDAFASVGKAVSSGRRVEILDVLANGERSVDGLAEQVALSVANTSQHLQILKQAGLVATRRSGTSIRYRLSSPEVFPFLSALRALAAARLGNVDRLASAYLGDVEGEAEVTREHLARKLGENRLVVLDVRPREEFEAGHLPGAVSAPLDELTEHVRGLPRDAEIVVYCRGPYCAYSYGAVELLRERGFRAVRLEDGLPEWEAEGRPVERSVEEGAVGPSVSEPNRTTR